MQDIGSELYNFRRVDERLISAGQPSEAQLAALASSGIEAVINLALHDDPRYSLPDEPGLAAALGLEYVHIPVQFGAPRETDLLDFCAAMERLQDRRVLVHCAANMRVSAFLGLYFAIRKGQPPESAFALMKTLWEPDDVWSAFIAAMLTKHGGDSARRA